jgi:hypothetical protein
VAVDSNFLAGVIEGFYGQPWSQGERFQLFDWMSDWGLNTYFYAPKDDLKHRALWREIYTEEECEGLRSLIAQCTAKGLRFIYGIAPGLDIKYSEDWEITVLKVRIEQMQKLGCRDFAILFDDIPDRMSAGDAERFGSFAKAQSHVANTLLTFLEEGSRLLFCPTPYCGRMASAGLGGENYLATLGKGLSARIDIFWTGPEIISREITVEHVKELQGLLRRKPVIWDNLHANDYDRKRFYVGPFSGRSPELKNEVKGILSNPNCEFPLNFVPIHALAQLVGGNTNSPRQQYVLAVHEWWRTFKLARGMITPQELVLFTDCFYLPYRDGDEAVWLLNRIKEALKSHKPVQEINKLRDFCIGLSELRNRPLFYALSRYAWDLKEELDLLAKFLGGANRSDFHLPGTFRGGFVVELQKLLKQRSDGSFEA